MVEVTSSNWLMLLGAPLAIVFLAVAVYVLSGDSKE